MKRIKRAVCWWFGCIEDPAAIEVGYWPPPCIRCGAPDITYSDLIGDTRHGRMMEWIRRWVLFGWVRRFVPMKCADCGKRYGPHKDCLPF